MRALWSDRQNCSHNVSRKVKRIKRLSDTFPNSQSPRTLDVPIRGAQFAADRIAPIRSDLKSHDSNRNPKFRSIHCDVFTIFFKCLGFFKSRDSIRAIRFASGS